MIRLIYYSLNHITQKNLKTINSEGKNEKNIINIGRNFSQNISTNAC